MTGKKRSYIGKFVRVHYLDHAYFHGDTCFANIKKVPIPTWTVVGLVVHETDQAFWIACAWLDDMAHLNHVMPTPRPADGAETCKAEIDNEGTENIYEMVVRGAIVELEVLGEINRAP